MSSAVTEQNLVRTVVHLRLSFWERLRVFFGASLTVFTNVMVEKDPTQALSLSAWVEMDSIRASHDLYPKGRIVWAEDARTLPKESA